MIIKTGKHTKPRRIMLYGVHGIGKSTWANQPGALFFNVEDGLGDIDCMSTERIRTLGDLRGGLSWVGANPQGINAVVLDTADWTEKLIWKQVAQDAGKSAIEEIGYGKGYKLAADKYWPMILQDFAMLREIGITIIILAHAKIERFQNPEGDSYDRYSPDLHDAAGSMLMEWCDEVLFASARVYTKQEDLGFNKTRAIAVDGKERYIRTSESGVALAKNRLNLPPELPFAFWGVNGPDGNLAVPGFGHYLPKLTKPTSAPVVTSPVLESEVTAPTATVPAEEPTGNIAGVVVNGSSKLPELAGRF